MSYLFEKVEDGRFLKQTGMPVFKYDEPNALKSAYRTVVEALYLPEHYVPVALAAVGATFSENPSLTFVFGFSAGIVLTSLSKMTNFAFISATQLRDVYFDRDPRAEVGDFTDTVKAGTMCTANLLIGSGINIATLQNLVPKTGFLEFYPAAFAGLTLPWFISAIRYARVTTGSWSFHSGKPPSQPIPEKTQSSLTPQHA